MAKKYSVFAKAYAGVIKRGLRKIEDVRPDKLKQDVIELLASEGLGPDGKPLAKEEAKGEKPVEDKKEDKQIEVEVSPEETKEKEPKDDIKEPEGEDKKKSEEDKEDK